ncbi:hypothetical protein [Geoalkalibacter subterraneus]|uniref:Uncharacterized protein n=1 Tax=Geoalkalibacter subterraneus TaxID=483547 RepID=A0A0B5FJG2_9BACT|nr:hypothetical protein [Geoalkalibacter subterraneus]AJF08307.1 hypothetical protein GSUB_17705 [Geoalkalibacter subterraneus]
MSINQVQIVAQILETQDAFYKEVFPNFRVASMFVVNGFPKFFHHTIEEIKEILSDAEIEKIASALEWKMGPDYALDGKDVLEVCPQEVASKVKKLPLFALCCLELLGFMRTSKRPRVTEGVDHILATPSIDEWARDFYAQAFPSVNYGVAFIMERFPEWYKNATDLSQAERDLVCKAMQQDIEGFSSILCGNILDEAFVRARANNLLSKKEQTLAEKICKMDFFKKSCLAVMGSAKIQRNKVISPKTTSSVASFFKEEFAGKTTGGILYAAESFRALFPALLAEALEPFSKEEKKIIRQAMQYHGRPEGLMAGALIIPAIRGLLDAEQNLGPQADVDQLVKKIEKMSLVHKSCLEVWGYYGAEA